MFAVFICSQKSSSAYFHCFSDKSYDIYTFFLDLFVSSNILGNSFIFYCAFFLPKNTIKMHQCDTETQRRNDDLKQDCVYSLHNHCQVGKWTEPPGTGELINWQIDRADDSIIGWVHPTSDFCHLEISVAINLSLTTYPSPPSIMSKHGIMACVHMPLCPCIVAYVRMLLCRPIVMTYYIQVVMLYMRLFSLQFLLYICLIHNHSNVSTFWTLSLH